MLLPNPSRHIRDNQRAVENLALRLARRQLAIDAEWPGVSDAVLAYERPVAVFVGGLEGKS
jgi:hypothetical protein